MSPLFVVLVLAPLLAHGAPAQTTSFGSSVLAEMESKLAAGAPLDELKSILDDIRARLDAADVADQEAQAADDQYCSARDAKLSTDIDLENSKINYLTSEIKKDNDTVNEMTALIASLDKIISDLDDAIAENEQTQADATAERELQNAIYLNNTRDAGICIDAINEILALGGMDALAAHQDDTSANYQEGVRLAVLLQELSKKISAPDVMALVQISALTVATLDKGDVDRLNALLNQLSDELKQYKINIKEDERVQLEQYNIRMADLRKQNQDLRSERARRDSERDDAYVRKVAAEARIAANTVKRADAIASRDALTTELNDLRAGCAQRKADHEKRVQDRIDERNTLQQIEDILNEKLGKHFSANGGHLADRAADVTSGGTAGEY